jgi:hypothetical protein
MHFRFFRLPNELRLRAQRADWQGRRRFSRKPSEGLLRRAGARKYAQGSLRFDTIANQAFFYRAYFGPELCLRARPFSALATGGILSGFAKARLRLKANFAPVTACLAAGPLSQQVWPRAMRRLRSANERMPKRGGNETPASLALDKARAALPRRQESAPCAAQAGGAQMRAARFRLDPCLKEAWRKPAAQWRCLDAQLLCPTFAQARAQAPIIQFAAMHARAFRCAKAASHNLRFPL